jgi:HEAT repeat protein
MNKVRFIVQSISVILSLAFFSEGFSATEISNDEILSILINGDDIQVAQALLYISRRKPAKLSQLLVNVILSDEDNRVKENAISALGKYPVNQYVPLLLNVLKKADSFTVKKSIIDVLATSEDRRIVLPLVDELSSPFLAVRKSAILALRRIGDDRMFPYILSLGKRRDPIYRVYALEAIYHVYDKRLYYFLMEMLGDENKSVRYYALRCIENNNLNQALSQVRNLALHDDNYEVRVKAIEVLGGVRDYNSLYVLLRCISDENNSVRHAAAMSLYLIGQSKSAYSLSNQLYRETDDSIKELIIKTLVKIKNGGGFKGLERVLTRDRNPKMRVLAAYALGEIRDRRAVSILLKALYDKDLKVRSEACHSLGFYRERIVVRQLIEVINRESSRYVKTAALYAIMSIGDKSSILPLFDRYAREKDPVFKELLRSYLRDCIKKYI